MTVFFYKENNSNDRDVVKYIETSRLGDLECGHYFPSIKITGACFSASLEIDNLEDITSILTIEEFQKLDLYNKQIHELGYGINEGDERFIKGKQLFETIKPIVEKLQSAENENLFKEVIEQEKEFLEDEYGLDTEDIEVIFNNDYLMYRDRGIVSCVFNDISECAEEEASQLGYVGNNKGADRYFNYEAFGEDLLEEERYLKLSDGRIVCLNY